jgi:DNA ligase-1
MKQPMLAAKEAKPELRFPCWASPKVDGIRAVVKDNILLSRTMIPIPNHYTQDLFGVSDLEGLDGELAVGPLNAPDVMQKTMSGVMSQDGEPDVIYWVFDYWTDEHAPFGDRILRLSAGLSTNYIGPGSKHSRVCLLPQRLINNAEELKAFEDRVLAEGYEGVMTRAPEGLYKFGRSTPKQQWLVKHKQWSDAEAVVIGFEERMHNANEATIDERGYTKRSSHQDNLVPMGTLGALIVRDVASGIVFRIGTGFADAERQYIWDNQSKYLHSIAVYKTFKQTGVKDAPRFPVFKAFRDARDIMLDIPSFLRKYND